jgi:outer membrane protein
MVLPFSTMCGQIVDRMRAGGLTATSLFIAMVLMTPGCSSPFQDDPAVAQDFSAVIDREIAHLAEGATAVKPPEADDDVTRALAERRDELEAISPATDANRRDVELDSFITGDAQPTVELSLDNAIRNAVRNNLDTGIARLLPAITAEDITNAQAVFDFVLFANADFAKIDQPSTVPQIGGFSLGTPFNASETYRFETGVRKTFTTGGQLSLSTDLTRLRNRVPGFALSPDPAYTAAVHLGFSQPLLRGFGEDVNTASIRFAENANERARWDLVSSLLNTVSETEAAYWSLVFAWRSLEIQQWLVDVGVEVRDVLDRRRDFDTRLAEYADAVARVQQRRADVIRLERQVRAASDRLKLLMNDPELVIASEALLKPTDALVETPIAYDLREMLVTAIQQRPEIHQARLSVDDAEIGAMLADNARLPMLNLTSEIVYTGMDKDSIDAYENTSDADFIDYILGLHFEYPLGNRGPESQYRKARLQRSQSLLGYQKAVQLIVFDLKSALRDAVTNYTLINATRSFRIAQAENLRALLVEEETLAGLTPEFLNLKFQRQETLAGARLQELQAIVEFDQALAALYRSMGSSLKMRQIEVDPADADADNR